MTFCYEAGPDRLRSAAADQEPRPRVHCGGAVADPEEAWRSGEDQPARRRELGEAAAGGRADRGLGSRRTTRGDARSHAGARDGGDRSAEQSASRSRRCCCGWGGIIRRARRPGGRRTGIGWRSQKFEHRGAAHGLRRDDAGGPTGARTHRAAGASYPCGSGGLVAGSGGRRRLWQCAASIWSRRRRCWRSWAICRAFENPHRADGISRPRAASESSTGETSSAARSPRPATGGRAALLVEAAWSYRHPPRVGIAKQAEGRGSAARRHARSPGRHSPALSHAIEH